MSWALGDCRIIGGMRPVSGAAPFAAAAVVLASSKAPELLRVTRYEPGEVAVGKPLTAEEWSVLRVSEQAQQLRGPIPAVTGAWMWIFRRSFQDRDAALAELRRSGALLDEERDPDTGTWTLLVLEPQANPLRDRWAEMAFTHAERHALAGAWEHAKDAADLAFVLDRSMRAERVAMLSLAYSRLGRTARSEGYLEMARRSRGDAFAEAVAQAKEALAAACLGAPAPRGAIARPKHAVAMQASSRRFIELSLRNMAA